jgi:6-phosphogluconolactonase (cycloisomerase 2 family)
MAFLPNIPKVLVLCELASRLEVLEIGSDGRLERQEQASIFTHTDGGAHWSSDVAVRPDGAFAYAINRDPPEIVAFALSTGGFPQRRAALALSAPVRSFAMAPDGSYLQVGGEDGVLHSISVGRQLKESSSLSGLGPIRHAEVIRLDGTKSSKLDEN